MSAENLGAPLPPEPAARWFEVISPKGFEKLRVVILDPTYYGRWVHWEGTPFPCEETEDCDRCKRGLGSRWQGWVGVYDMERARRAVAALTEGAARQMAVVLKREGSLRGVRCSLKRRHPKKNNSPVDVIFAGTEPLDTLPTPHDIIPSIERLFGINLSRFGQKRYVRPATAAPDESWGIPLPGNDQGEEPPPFAPGAGVRVGEILDSIGRQVS